MAFWAVIPSGDLAPPSAFPHYLENALGKVDVLDPQIEHFGKMDVGIEQQQEKGVEESIQANEQICKTINWRSNYEGLCKKYRRDRGQE